MGLSREQKRIVLLLSPDPNNPKIQDSVMLSTGKLNKQSHFYMVGAGMETQFLCYTLPD